VVEHSPPGIEREAHSLEPVSYEDVSAAPEAGMLLPAAIGNRACSATLRGAGPAAVLRAATGPPVTAVVPSIVPASLRSVGLVGALRPELALALQRTAGNWSTTRYLLRAAAIPTDVQKLFIGGVETTEVAPEIVRLLESKKIRYAREVTFVLLDDAGKAVLKGRFDFVFRDPRTGQLVIPETKGIDLEALTPNQRVYVPRLEGERGVMIRITSKKGGTIDLPAKSLERVSGEHFLRIGRGNLKDFADALEQITTGERVKFSWRDAEGIRYFKTEEEFEAFLETKGIKRTVPGPAKPDLMNRGSSAVPPGGEPGTELVPKPAPPSAEAPVPKPPTSLKPEAPPVQHTTPPVGQTPRASPEAAPTKPPRPIFVPHVEPPVASPGALRRALRVLRDIGRELASLKVLVPLQILLEVLNAVEAYSMAMGGMSGRGFIFGEQIAALRRIGRELESSLAACRRLDDELTQATTLAALGSKEAIDGLRELAPQLAIQVHNRFVEAQERRLILLQIKQEADEKAAVASALLESREVPFITGMAGSTIPQAQMLAAYQDMLRMRSLANDALKHLDSMIAVLQADIETLAHYWLTAP
jgi:hypothetical protein